ncbi:Sec-independent protein translocase protein TatB [Acetobacter sp.]|jgi:sec-independent protein translocase protein TatB|uniref:Sec-independent protein translocase protein TatB n=1 Tax=Acetobacter sp. TaxID=440 RepID=UPI0025C4F086|nr:Sec-independent protein translocase protein TatB [Acetobacter sp.]MCH4092536.1 Sec-independent protein translocase protein TatB [Acetobacter sp.]MCI1299670.1 Sec-independent protein translocase protein TatB [Acetobacter sp.]MCI1315450.1 Sec-independent protein translocase protein TatB [Acetobacter sp.]
MFDFAWSEFALIGVVALLVIGPKDMPTAIRSVAKVVKKARRLASDFQGHVDEMVREADLGEVRDQVRQFRSLNVRSQIMRTIDNDGSLRRTFDDPTLKGRPFDDRPKALSTADAPALLPPPPREAVGSSPLGIEPLSFADGTPQTEPGEAPAPAMVPPAIARRIASAWPRLRTPAILPPSRVLHGNRRVAPFTAPVSDAPAPDIQQSQDQTRNDLS